MIEIEDKNDELEDLIYGELGICGCGCPDEVVEMIVEFLKRKIEYREKIMNSRESHFKIYDEEDKWLNEFKEENKGLLYTFFLYMLNNKGFMEHGTSIYSSWVDEKGKKLIECFEREKH